jgi:hypothetical protein
LLAQALRSGLFGFTTGLSIGKALVEEQASLLNNLLGYTSNLLGSPYAEMIWCQVSCSGTRQLVFSSAVIIHSYTGLLLLAVSCFSLLCFVVLCFLCQCHVYAHDYGCLTNIMAASPTANNAVQSPGFGRYTGQGLALTLRICSLRCCCCARQLGLCLWAC